MFETSNDTTVCVSRNMPRARKAGLAINCGRSGTTLALPGTCNVAPSAEVIFNTKVAFACCVMVEVMV